MSTHLKLKPEIKALWTAALTSGEYSQGRGVLKNDHGDMCCLGVLCDIHRKTSDAPLEWGPHRAYGLSGGVPPEAVMDWAFENYTGVEDRACFLADKNHNLASTNDAGASFSEIADIITKEF